MKHLSFVLFFTLLFQVVPVSAQTANDPLNDRLWYLDQIHAPEAWNTTTGNRGVVVAVIDTGVDLDHPDIAGNLWVNPNEIPGDGVDNDRNGFIDDVNGWDFIDRDANPSPVDVPPFDASAVSHGTLVAGIIGAVGNNGEGISGINWQVQIMSLRILNRVGSGTETDAISAIEYALNNGADVINMSFTGREVSTRFQHQVKRAYDLGVTFIASVGNDGRSSRGNLNRDPIYPACLKGVLDDDWVIGVAATTGTDEKADFSNYGRDCTDIAAPGVEMFGTGNYNLGNPFFDEPYIGYWQGTSASAPVITGSVALLLSRFPTLTPSQVKIILQLSVDPTKTRGTEWFGQLGAGRVNIARALSIASAFGPPIVRGVTHTPIALSAGPGEAPEVNFFENDGSHLASYLVYQDTFRGGVSVLLDDFDQDGEVEFAVVPRSGGEAQVRWFEMDGTLRGDFKAFAGVVGGFSIASGDIDADGKTEFLVMARGGEGRVEVYDLMGAHKKDLAIPIESADQISVGDVDGTLGDEIILSSSMGAPIISILKENGTVFNTITAGDPTETFGVSVALADLTSNGRKEIVVASRKGGSQMVRAFTFQGTLAKAFLAGAEDSKDGLKLSAGDVNADGLDDVTVLSDAHPTHFVTYSNGQEIARWGIQEFVMGDVELGAWSF